MADTVHVENPVYYHMARKWGLIDVLLGGTEAIQKGGTKWLPRETKEDSDDYNVRLQRSYLYEAYKDATQKLAARPFERPIQIEQEESLPDELRAIVHDADLTGNSLTQFSHLVFRDAVQYGMGHILVDYPMQGDQTLADRREFGIRPYFVRIHPKDLFGWKTEKDSTGRLVLTQIRFREFRVEDDPTNEYGETVYEYVKVITPDDWQLWRRKVPNASIPRYRQLSSPTAGGSSYVMVDTPDGSGKNELGYIPLVTVYADRRGFMMSEPPLYGLARLNLRHYQSLSDQTNILRFARLPLYSASGVTPNEKEQGLEIAPNRIVMSTNSEFKLEVVEHSGKAIEAGERDIEQIEKRMQVLSLMPYIERSGKQTATARALDESRQNSAVHGWIRGCEDALEHAFLIAADWASSRLPVGFRIWLYSEFGITIRAAEDVRFLTDSYLAGKLDKETWFGELRRRGVFHASLTYEEWERRMEENAQDMIAVMDGLDNRFSQDQDPPTEVSGANEASSAGAQSGVLTN